MSRAETIRGKNMGFTKITNAELNSRGATRLPNQPTIGAQALKEEFDAPAKQIVAPKVNNLIDELEASTSAGNLGAVAPTGRTGTTVQGVINSVSSDLATLEANAGTAIADAHTHSNKALLDTYTQTESDLASAVADDHTHSNKALLDTYTQTESDLASAVADDHTHSNKALLDTYTQSETDIADAVTKKHSHTNKSLLDSYTQTETDLADAVSKKHDHSNKTVLDKFGESGGNPTYDGNPIGGGGSASDTFKNIVSGGTTFVASGNNDTFKINAGSNVTITALSSPDKGISISATGGGQSTGDMLMSDYDQSGDVKAASSTGNGIKDFVASEIAKIDVDDLHDTSIASLADQDTLVYNGTSGTWGNEPLADVALTGAYSSLSGQPTIPDGLADLTDDVAISNPSSGQILQHNGTKWANANMPSIPDGLADLTDDVNISSPSNDQVLKYDGSSSKWINGSAPASGHNMLDNSTIISGIKGAIIEGTTNDDVVSGYGVGVWSNTDTITLLTPVAQGDNTVGTWEDDATWESGSRAYWLKHTALHGILSDDDVEISFVFDVADGEAISCLAYRVDDAITSSLGGIAIKFNAPIQNANGATVGVVLKRNRTNTETVPRTS